MNTNNSLLERYNGLYLERSGEGARDLVETLLESPELPLNDEQMAEAYSFEASLAGHQLDEGVTIESMISSQKEESVTAPLFFAAPFLDGSIDMSQFDSPEFSKAEDVYKWVATVVRDKSVDPGRLALIAKQSNVLYKKRAEEALIAGEVLTDEQLDVMSLVLRPEDIVLHGIQANSARQSLLEMRSVYKEGGERLDGAKRAIADVYLARVNEVIAKDIPVINYFMDQSRMIGDEAGKRVAESAIPTNLRRSLVDPKAREQLLKRLDYVRNGMGTAESGDDSAVSADLFQDEVLPENKSREAIFNAEEIAVLKSTQMTPGEIRQAYANIIHKTGLLSSEDPSTWTPTRKTRAKDGLFQVVENIDKATLSVDGDAGVYKVGTESRSIYDVLVVGGFHELTHIDQAQADQVLGDTLRIAKIKGKRVSMLREVGANINQRKAELMFFGKSKPVALTYAKALQTLEKGGDLFAATRSFYDEARRIAPSDSPRSIARVAADRVTRLVRQGGHSSQSMVYAEEAILNKELEGASLSAKERAVAITGLDLVDQVRLHKYGLLPIFVGEATDWTTLVVEELQPYINKALQDIE
ncbi:hypothetical protein D3C85_49420 [compost metagenome]